MPTVVESGGRTAYTGRELTERSARQEAFFAAERAWLLESAQGWETAVGHEVYDAHNARRSVNSSVVAFLPPEPVIRRYGY